MPKVARDELYRDMLQLRGSISIALGCVALLIALILGLDSCARPPADPFASGREKDGSVNLDKLDPYWDMMESSRHPDNSGVAAVALVGGVVLIGAGFFKVSLAKEGAQEPAGTTAPPDAQPASKPKRPRKRIKPPGE